MLGIWKLPDTERSKPRRREPRTMREMYKNTGKLAGIDRKGFSNRSRGRE